MEERLCLARSTMLRELTAEHVDRYKTKRRPGIGAWPTSGCSRRSVVSWTSALEALDDADFRLVAVFRDRLSQLPISNDLRRYAAALLRARRPEDPSPRAIHRFRRETEPWALDALAFVGAAELSGVVEAARRTVPAEPLVRRDELDLPPGPEIGRILALIDEERAAGTISTRDEALALARSLSGAEAST